MSEDVKKYCYNCKENIETIYNDGILCPGCYHPIKPKDDKLGFITFAEDYIKGKAKSEAFSKTYNFAKNFFLSKLASYFLVATVVVSSASTVSNVITTNKNKQYIEKPESIVEPGTINYIEIPTKINEEQRQSSTIVDNNIGPETMQQENEEIIEETNNEVAENVDEEIIESDENNYNISEDKWENFMGNFIIYCSNGNYDPNIFENGPVSGPVVDAFKNSGADIGSITASNGEYVYAYYYYDDGDYSSNDGDTIFGRLVLKEKENTYSIISDESSSITFEDIINE